MKPISASFTAFVLCFCVWTGQARAQQIPATSKSAPPLVEHVGNAGQRFALDSAQEASAAELIAQGKAFFRTVKLRQALAKFEAALNQEPDSDEALGLAAETAFRLDNQSAARKYFLRRAELSGQKDSVKAFCFQRVAMTHWREAHDLVAKSGRIRQGRVIYDLPEDSRDRAMESIKDGLEQASRAIEIRGDFADAYNTRNLLHAEAALAATDEEQAKEHRQNSLEDLKMALVMANPAPDGKTADIADFNYPTIRIAEFARTKVEDGQLEDPMMKAIEGGKALKRVLAVLPAARPPKSIAQTDDSAAQTAKPESTAIKVEVLVSTEGKVIFTHIVDGRTEMNSAAIAAARGWTFTPAMLDGEPVQLSGVISFDLKPSTAKPASSTAKAPMRKP